MLIYALSFTIHDNGVLIVERFIEKAAVYAADDTNKLSYNWIVFVR